MSLQLVWTVVGHLRKVVAMYVADFVPPLFSFCLLCWENGGGSSLQQNFIVFFRYQEKMMLQTRKVENDVVSK